MKRVLLISYYFPPLAGSGVFRPLRLAKYLPRYGWDVTVLCASETSRVLKDESLLSDVPQGVRIERTGSLEPRAALIALGKIGLARLARRIEPWFMIPDDQRGWVPFAVRRAARILREVRHDAVVSTAGPYSAHLVGRTLHRRFGVPWIADFRDEWTTNPYLAGRYPTAWHRRLNRRLEQAVVREADRVVGVSRPWLDAIHSVAPELPGEKFHVHPNGFDAAHFAAIAGRFPDRFRVVYTGTFYGHRSPKAFLAAIDRVVAQHRIPADDLEVLLVGHTGHARLLGRDTSTRVRVVEHRPYFETLPLLMEAAVLLLVVPREGGPGNHTGKLFPYLASGRPILALAPEPNVAAELIRASRSGVVAPPDDIDAIAAALCSLHRDWKRGKLLADQDRSLVATYEAGTQAESYARLLDDASKPRTVDTSRPESFSSK